MNDDDFDWDDYLCCWHLDPPANSGGNRNGKFPVFQLVLIALLIAFFIFYYRSQL